METECLRCGTRCRLDAPGNPDARMLRRCEKPGLCVNCAVHDFLRNCYPVNMQLAESGPGLLAHPHIQELFAGIMRVGLADAMPDEINWNLIIQNWDLPFRNKIKKSSTNPCSQLELDEIATGERAGLGDFHNPKHPAMLRAEDLTITSFEQLNELEPRLGDDLRRCVEGPE